MTDLKKHSKKLGRYHREVWEFHDLEAFEKLATSAHALLVVLEFEDQSTKEAADHIMHAYVYADKAVDAMKADNPTLEQKMYAESAKHLKQARSLLQLETKGGEYEAKWWYAFRHRDGAEVGRLLYEELQFHTNDPEFSLLGAYFLSAAARYHSKRDWEQVETLLQQYWHHMLEHKYRFLAGGL